MPHELNVDGERIPLGDVVDIGRGAGKPLLRLIALAGGGAAVISATEATRDGRPLIGRLGIIGWGSGALVRAGRLRVEIAWRAAAARQAGRGDDRCRLCFGAFAPGEVAVTCRSCQVLFHLECDEVRLDCLACGASRVAAP